jgi:hypothetical protein
MALTPEDYRRQIEANEERSKEKEAEHDLALEVIEIGYKAIKSTLRPKLPIDQKHLRLLKIAKEKLLRFVERG